ncbi:hypothetical protein LOD99_8275 [Oopsacas minuta]|uniref:Uncharacterized protein n=1 Tax=Oopsacas minuta TaxID=111878 RepID=A0AAV7JGX4_9METZ|nr:hypothetical protein LOD99_8275 [Oopsacas minuta]
MDVERPEWIYEACLAANTHLKNAIKTTPFRLMFGRDFNPAYLFQAINIEVEEYNYSNSKDDVVIEPETQESIFDPSIDANERIEDLDSCRKAEWEVARTNIIHDQARQKRIFDARVQLNRYYLITGVFNLFLTTTHFPTF